MKPTTQTLGCSACLGKEMDCLAHSTRRDGEATISNDIHFIRTEDGRTRKKVLKMYGKEYLLRLQIGVSEKTFPICRLPRCVLDQAQQTYSGISKSQSIVQIISAKDTSRCCYGVCIGEVGHSQHTDIIEVSYACLSKLSAGTNEWKHDEPVDVRIVRHIPVASRLYLTPKSEFDWDLVSTYANIIEETLSRSQLLVFLDKPLHIAISPSLVASLSIQSSDYNIELLRNARDDGLLHNIIAIGDGTELAIEPPKSLSSVSRTVKIRNENTNATVLGTAPSSNEVENDNFGKEFLKSLQISKFIEQIPLRVQPTHWRCCNSNHLSSSYQSHCTLSMISKHYCTDDALNSKGELAWNDMMDEVLNQFDQNGDHLSNSMSQATSYPWQSCPSSLNQSNVIFIHPITIQEALQRAAGLSLVSKAVVSKFLSVQNHKKWVSTVLKETFLTNSLVSSTQYCRLVISDHVRPFSISLPAQIQRLLQLEDYSTVRLRIFTSCNSILPQEIIFRPIWWSQDTMIKVPESTRREKEKMLQFLQQKCSSRTMQEEFNTTVTNPIVVFFLRHIDEFSVKDHSPFLLFPNSIISLPVGWSDKGCPVETIDFIVEFSCKEDEKNKNHKPFCVSLDLWDKEEDKVFAILNSVRVDTSNLVELSDNKLPQHDKVFNASKRESLLGFESISKSLLLELSSHYSPNFLWKRLCQQSSSDCKSVYAIDGASGSGKTKLLQTLLHPKEGIIASNPRLAVHIEYIDAKSLVRIHEITVEKALNILSSAFQRAAQYAPSIVCIDHVHIFCKPFSEEMSMPIRDERSLLLMIHLQRLLRSVQQENHRQWISTLQRYQNYKTNNAALASDASFIREALSNFYLTGHVLVIMTTEDLYDTIDASLWPNMNGINNSTVPITRTGKIDRVFSMPYLTPNLRWKMFLRELHNVQCAVAHCQGTEIAQRKKWFVHHTEGYALQDIITLVTLLKEKSQQQEIILLSNNDIISQVNSLWNSDSIDNNHITRNGFDDGNSSVKEVDDLLVVDWAHVVEVISQYIPVVASFSKQSQNNSYTKLVANTRNNPYQKKKKMDGVGGYNTVKTALYRTLRFPLLYQRLYAQSPIKLPRAMMLFGPPGVGKTYIAQAIGEEFGMGFISVRGPQLIDKYIGASEKAVRDLFQQAQALQKPVLLFFDEFDALAPKRGKDNTGVTDRIVNQLLTFIDGVEGTRHGHLHHATQQSLTNATHHHHHPLDVNDYDGYDSDPDANGTNASFDDKKTTQQNSTAPIFLLIASSRPDLIDPALLRPGRIEKHVYMGYPNDLDVIQILQAHIRHTSHTTHPTVDNADEDSAMLEVFQRIVQQKDKIQSFTAADLKAVVDTAYLLAVHDHLDTRSSLIQRDHVAARNNSVQLLPEHIWRAFQETRPSIAPQDRQFFESVYERFLDTKKKSNQQGDSMQGPAAAAMNNGQGTHLSSDQIGLFRSAKEIATQKTCLH